MAEVFIEQGRQQGLAEAEAKIRAREVAMGWAHGVLRVLAIKGIHVDESSRQRIEACVDIATLENWVDRAVVATCLSEVLDGSAQ
jgi:hypothetical protein